ncbi:MAG: hypothetical protein FWB79_01320 [Treponema sp.]|nr:hypothetical protein [Treponema sp.]
MKIISKTCLLVFSLAFLFASCNNGLGTDDERDGLVTGRVTFFNESSYRVNVRRDSFSGPIEVELSSGETRTVDVRVSDHALGTTFAIEYLFQVTDGFDADSGDIFASGTDLNVQINRIIEENRSITIQIPQPTNLEFRTAFVRILNAHNLPIELRYFGSILRQDGTGNIPVAPGRTGVYRLNEIPAGGERLFEGFRIVSTFATTLIPGFTAQNGVIYNFTYNGNSVTKTGEQTIIFE